MAAHARLGPSNTRWPECPGSIREEAAYPDTPPGEAAVDGTGSHLLLELCGGSGLAAKSYRHQTIGEGHEDCPDGWRVEYDRAERVQMALDYIARRKGELTDATVEFESQSDPGYWIDRDDWWGTCDVTITSVSDGVLEVVDYKDGRGWVSDDTKQLVSYAIGKLMPYIHQGGDTPLHPAVITPEDLKQCVIQTIRTTIVQPRTTPPVRYRDVPVNMFWAEARALMTAAKATDDPDAPLLAGEHCRWCKHKPNCVAVREDKVNETVPALTSLNQDMANAATLILSNPEQAPDSALVAVLDAKKQLTDLIKAAEDEAKRRIDSGATVPGYILAPGRATRKWSDEAAVWTKLKNMGVPKAEAYETKILSPAKVEKMERLNAKQKGRLSEFIVTVDGKPTLKKGTPKAEKVVDFSAQKLTFV